MVSSGFEKLVGKDAKFRDALIRAQKAASTDEPVLILGDSGTGKELLARAIHQISSRARKPFVTVNCSAIPDTLVESEFFGYERGAFTGARTEGRVGYFEEANGGTILLDEVGDASLQVQAKLLRVLEDGCFKRIGGNRDIKVDVRIISSTNRDLEKLMREQKLREDLFYRLNTFTIFIPSLAERKGDIRLLIDHFLRLQAERQNREFKLLPSTTAILEAYQWPGNVRELKGVINYAVSMTDGTNISPKALPVFFRAKKKALVTEMRRPPVRPAEKSPDLNLKRAVEKFEKDFIQDVLAGMKNRTEAIRALGISRRSFYMKLKQYGLDPDE